MQIWRDVNFSAPDGLLLPPRYLNLLILIWPRPRFLVMFGISLLDAFAERQLLYGRAMAFLFECKSDLMVNHSVIVVVSDFIIHL